MSFSYGQGSREVHALENINATVERGEFISLIGPSGCGKSTLLLLVGGLLEAEEGQILVNGKQPDEARLAREYGFAFQKPVLLPWHTVLRNVCEPLKVFGQSKAERIATAMPLLELVGLADFKDAYPSQLSGGMQQRVSLARALSFKPGVLLMDEPFGALDEITRQKMNLELLRLWRELNMTVLLVTHNILEAAFLSDRVLAMSPRPGRIAEVIEVNLPRPRARSLISEPEFLAVVDQIRAGIGIEGEA